MLRACQAWAGCHTTLPSTPRPCAIQGVSLSKARRCRTVTCATETDSSLPNTQPMQALEALARSQIGTATAAESGIADVARDIMLADPETAEQLKRYEAALARAEAVKAAQKELEEIFAQAGRDLVQAEAEDAAERRRKADAVMAAAEVAAAEKLLAAAQLEAARASQDQARWAQEANLGAERLESTKAGGVAALGGLLSALPLTLTASAPLQDISTLLTLGTTLGSCFLFGVAYRYVVRFDADNSHLRNGAVGAFGLVRAAAAGDILQTSSLAGPLDVLTVVGPAALYTGQSMILFAFSAAAVEVAFRQKLVKRFGQDPATTSM